MRLTKLTAPFDLLVSELPQALEAHPSMMAYAEKAFLYGLAKDYFRGEGIIIDAGIFLGASSMCFGMGLQKNKDFFAIKHRFTKPIYSFDLAIVNTSMPALFSKHKLPFQDLVVGDTFAPQLRKLIAPVSNLISLRVGDVTQTMLHVRAPVEILFLDLLKTPSISKAVIAHFYRRLIPGLSIVVQQDYFIDKLEFIKTHQETFRDYFECVGEISSSCIFRCTRKIDREAIEYFLEDETITPAQQEQLAMIALERTSDPARRYMMAISRARLLRKLRGRKVAFAALAAIKAEHWPFDVRGYSRLQNAMREAEEFCQPLPQAPLQARNRPAKDVSRPHL